MTHRTTERSIARAISGVRAAGLTVGRVIIHAGGVIEIIAAGEESAILTTGKEVAQCDDIFSRKARPKCG